jgi:hypothetical protein
MVYSPNTPAANSTAGGENIACFNNNQDLKYFDIICPSDAKAYMTGLALKMTFQFVQTRAGPTRTNAWNVDVAAAGPPAKVGGVTCAIPWNPLVCFRTASLKVNNGLIPVESYINDGQFGHITTLRILRQYSAQALETADDSFFTPCIESKLDADAAGGAASQLSDETQARSRRWCIPPTATQSDSGADANYVTCTKIIPFSLLFETCSVPGIWTNCSRFRFEFTLQAPGDIPLTVTHSAGVAPYVFITGLELLYDSTNMTATQFVETSTEKATGTVENIGYLYNEIFTATYTPNTQLVLSNQKNIQFYAMAFSAAGQTINARACRNPYQYYNAGITSLTSSYGNDTPLKIPINLTAHSATASRSYGNSMLYSLYRKCSGRESTKQLTPAVSFERMSQYHIYWIPVFYQCSGAHITNDPRDIRINANGGNAVPVILCTTKLEVTQITSSGDVSSMGR